jgi:hypothetical protein
MRFHAKGACLLLLCCLAGFPAALAQQKPTGSTETYRITGEATAPPARPLTLDEGLAILNAALDSRHYKGFSSDCSHFVHGLYQRAGFSYEYAPSSDLYAGIDEFRRVTNPQPGDLAVWHGHAGIVVNPAQHSFFSLLRSGPGVDSYDSPYWKRRGRPRFFRYVKTTPSALSGSIRTASLSPTPLDNAGRHQPTADDLSSNELEEFSSESGSSAKLAVNRSVNSAIPTVSVVHSIHPKPEQVNAAFLQACADLEENLRGRDLFKSAQPVIVFDHVAVRKVHIAGNLGWAEIQIDELVSLTGGKAQLQKLSERQLWPLSRRDKTSWELAAPRGTIYLPQQLAVRVLSHQLVQMTEERPDATAMPQQKAELARVLDSLLRE